MQRVLCLLLLLLLLLKYWILWLRRLGSLVWFRFFFVLIFFSYMQVSVCLGFVLIIIVFRHSKNCAENVRDSNNKSSSQVFFVVEALNACLFSCVLRRCVIVAINCLALFFVFFFLIHWSNFLFATFAKALHFNYIAKLNEQDEKKKIAWKKIVLWNLKQFQNVLMLLHTNST